MSHYDEVLEEARNQATSTAKVYIPRLYRILVDEEHKTAEDARKIIEHDLLEYWSKATVTKFLPHEAKDEEKVKAGKQGAKATNLVLAGGQTVTTKSDEMDYVSPKGNDDEKKAVELENEFLKEKVTELEDALHKVSDKQFIPATDIQEPQKEFNIDEAFKKLPDDDAMTCWKINSISGTALKNRILSWQGNSLKFFRVWMQEVKAP